MLRQHSRALALTVLFAGAGTQPLRGQSKPSSTPVTATAADRDEVRRAALDYLEGFYEGDSAKLVRSVRRDVFKYGFWLPRDSTKYAGEQMTWPEFLDYARRVKQNNRPAPATAPKRVEVFDVQNQTAAVKVTAFWGTDYLLLGKYDGKWMISSVMWQSPPRPAPAGGT
jgi:hypothetical protein